MLGQLNLCKNTMLTILKGQEDATKIGLDMPTILHTHREVQRRAVPFFVSDIALLFFPRPNLFRIFIQSFHRLSNRTHCRIGQSLLRQSKHPLKSTLQPWTRQLSMVTLKIELASTEKQTIMKYFVHFTLLADINTIVTANLSSINVKYQSFWWPHRFIGQFQQAVVPLMSILHCTFIVERCTQACHFYFGTIDEISTAFEGGTMFIYTASS